MNMPRLNVNNLKLDPNVVKDIKEELKSVIELIKSPHVIL